VLADWPVARFEAGLDEANHPVYEYQQFVGARWRRQGLGFITLIEFAQARYCCQRRKSRDQAISGLT
jgi:hypothetical protein